MSIFKSSEQRDREEYRDGYDEGRNTGIGTEIGKAMVESVIESVSFGLISRSDAESQGYKDGLDDRFK